MYPSKRMKITMPAVGKVMLTMQHNNEYLCPEMYADMKYTHSIRQYTCNTRIVNSSLVFSESNLFLSMLGWEYFHINLIQFI